MKIRRRRKPGFSLIEILVAVSIMAMAMGLVAAIYSQTVTAWRLGQNVMDELHQGDFVIDQAVAALRSTAFFPNNPKWYGFWLQDHGAGDSAHDDISFVTSSSAFMPSDSPLQGGLHRIFMTIDQDKNGRHGLAIRAAPLKAIEMDENRIEPWIASTRVTGFDCQVYDFDLKRWSDEWMDTNKVPNLVKITLTIQPAHEDNPPLVVSRVVEIPISAAVGSAPAQQTATNAATAAVGPGGLLRNNGQPGVQPRIPNQPGNNRPPPTIMPGGNPGSNPGSGGFPFPPGGNRGGGSVNRTPFPFPPGGGGGR